MKGMIYKMRKRIANLIFYALAFVIPAVVLIFYFKIAGIVPFGKNSLLSMDLWWQYFPMMVLQHENRHNFVLNLFSWSGVLGVNIFTEFAYFCNSFFNYLLLPFAKEQLIAVFDYIILLKFSCASLAFCIYLKGKFKRLDMLTVAFSVVYAFCAYAIAYLNQPMWFDCLIFLPIIVLGLERLINEKKVVLYTVMLAVSIFSCFYISFSICLFIAIYFFVLLLAGEQKRSLKEYGSIILRFAVFSLIAGGITAFVLIPVYKSVGLTVASEYAFNDKLRLYIPLNDFLGALFPRTKIFFAYYTPNIYTGVCMFILVPLFIANKSFSISKKLLYSLLVVFMYFSLNLNLLDFIWHGMHYPHQLPGRWSFIFSFVLITMAYDTLINIKGISRRTTIAAALYGVLVMAFAKTALGTVTSESAYRLSFYLLIIYTLLILVSCSIKKETLREVVSFVTALILIGEAGVNFLITEKRDGYINDEPYYTKTMMAMRSMTEPLADNENEFYRTEVVEGWTYGSQQLGNYKGISHYSSLLEKGAYIFFKDMGYRIYAENLSTIYNPYSPIMNSMLSLKYTVNRKAAVSIPASEKKEANADYSVWENKYWLPVGYAVSDDMLAWKSNSEISPLKNQESFLNSALGASQQKNIYNHIIPKSTSFDNVEISASGGWTSKTYTRINTDENVSFSFSYLIENSGEVLLEQNFRKGDAKISINGGEQKINLNKTPFITLGYLEKGTTVDVNVEIEDSPSGLYGLDLYSVDEVALAEAYSLLSRESVKVTEKGNTYINAEIELDERRTIFTSIAAEGWSVYCDGEKIESTKLCDYMLTFELPKGKHTLELKYRLPGLFVGSVISVASATLFILYIVMSRRKRRLAVLESHEGALEEAAAETETDFLAELAEDLNYPMEEEKISVLIDKDGEADDETYEGEPQA